MERNGTEHMSLLQKNNNNSNAYKAFRQDCPLFSSAEPHLDFTNLLLMLIQTFTACMAEKLVKTFVVLCNHTNVLFIAPQVRQIL